MEYMEFTECIREKMQEKYEGTAEIRINCVDKNNGVSLCGVTVAENGKNISPTIYLEHFYEEYEDGCSLEGIIEKIITIYEKCKIDDKLDMDFFLNFDQVKEHIVYKLIHAEKNRTLLDKIPHIEYLDLAIVFYCTIEDSHFGNATILIHNCHCKMWKTDSLELLKLAEKNSPRLLPYEIRDLEELIKGMFITSLKDDFKKSVRENSGEDIDVEFPEEWMNHVADQMIEENTELKDGHMFVMTNQKKLFGAATMMYEGALSSFAGLVNSNLYLLPSSIHEVIMLPDRDDLDALELQKMVREVNCTQLEEEDILSDSVYYYDRERDLLSLWKDMQEEESLI